MVDSPDRTRGIGWLHLSDLQIAGSSSALENPEVRAVLEKDLRRIHAVSGPWHVVAVTGNVTASGASGEFDRAASVFEWLWGGIRGLGSDPALIVVPGPWDVDRIERSDDDCSPLMHERDDEPQPSAAGPSLNHFAAFVATVHRKLGLRATHEGLLPGDSSWMIARDGLRLGVLGLNTWLPSRGPGGGLSRRQLDAACGARDLAAWSQGCDAVLLVSYHAGARLDAPARQLLGEPEVPMLVLSGPGPANPGSSPGPSWRRAELPGLSLGRYEVDQFGYRAGRIAPDDGAPVVCSWVRRLSSVAGTTALGPGEAPVEDDGAWRIALRMIGDESRRVPFDSTVTFDPQIRHIAWSPDGARVAVIRGQGVLVIHDRAGVQRATWSVHHTTPCAIAWSPSGDRIATRSRHHVRIWTTSGELCAWVQVPCPSPTAMVWRDDDLLVGSDDGVYRLVSPSNGAPHWPPSSARCHATPVLQLGRRVLALARSPSTALAAVGTDDGIRIIAVQELEDRLAPALRPDAGATHTLAWSPTAGIFAAGGTSGVVTVWSAQAPPMFTKRAQLEGLTDTVRSLSFSRDGALLAATAIDGSHAMWSCDDWSPHKASALRVTRSLNAIAFSPSADVAAVGAMTGLRIRSLAVAARMQKRSIAGGLADMADVDDATDDAGWAAREPDDEANDEEPRLGIKPDDEALRLRSAPGNAALQLRSAPHDADAFREGAILPDEVLDDLGDDEDDAGDDEDDAEPIVRTASAKVVLLGESNVGKSCLAIRLTQNRYEEIGSTHGMKFWRVPLEQLDPEAEIPPGERREVVFWDMGGQHEYRLLHHAFLHDTMLALMVMEPRRGEAALREIEGWDRELVPDRSRVARLLVGSKLDDDHAPRDPALVDRAVAQHGFTGFAATSARTGAGIEALRRQIARTIDWGAVAVTSRPLVFHRIRHYIELRRTARRCVLPYHELEDIVIQREGADVDRDAIDAVVKQLALQGLIADARLGDGSRMVILEVEQVERYAASLILAARDNPRGVPALEMASVASVGMSFPRISAGDRLPRDQELVVLECVIDLLIKSGICFLSGRLLIFPALFRDRGAADDAAPRGAVAVGYDFLGAADNVYSALVCWLALDVRFGALRLSEHRAELAMPGKGTCGLRRIAGHDGAGGGRFELYFDGDTDDQIRQLFGGVVDDFLRGAGVELIEQLAVACGCGYRFAEDDLRDRLGRGALDVGCPRCDARAPLVRTGADAHAAAPGLAARLRAFRSERLRTRQEATVAARRALDDAPRKPAAERAVHVLHLSDLHIAAGADLARLLHPLCSDLEDARDGLGAHRPDLVVISGDLTNRGSPEEFAAARDFVAQLLERCRLTAERCVVVPGNHDLSWDAPAYRWQPRRQVGAIDPAVHVAQGNGFLVRDERGYAERFRNFSEQFYHPLFQRPYSMAPEDQAECVLLADLGVQLLALNSAWQIDEYFPARSGIHLGALSRALDRAGAAVGDARRAGRLAGDPLRVAVWHHPITGNEKISDDAFVEQLRRAGFRLCLHGHVHEDRADVVGYLHPRKLQVLGAGSFGAPARERPESVPRLYNLIELDAARRAVRVHTRQLRRAGSAWEPWCVWPGAGSGERRAYYEFEVGGSVATV